MTANRRLLAHLTQDTALLFFYLSTGYWVLLGVAMCSLGLSLVRWDIVSRREEQERELRDRTRREIESIVNHVLAHGLKLNAIVMRDGKFALTVVEDLEP